MATEKWLIIPDELIAEIEILYQKHYVRSYDKTVHDIFNAVRRRIRRCAKVDAVKVVHGRWEEKYHRNPIGDYIREHCSVCGEDKPNATHTNYCPNCGAKMDGGVV